MSEFSKTARERLAANPPQQHPEADLLNGFAEHTLTTRERAQVTEHLSVCADCRDVVAIATAAAPEPATNAVAKNLRGTSRLAWMRWAVPVATMGVIALALFVRGGEFAPATRKDEAMMRERAPSTDNKAAESAGAPTSEAITTQQAKPERPAVAAKEMAKAAEPKSVAKSDVHRAVAEPTLAAGGATTQLDAEKKEADRNTNLAFAKDRENMPVPPAAARVGGANAVDGFIAAAPSKAKAGEPQMKVATAAAPVPAVSAAGPAGAGAASAKTSATAESAQLHDSQMQTAQSRGEESLAQARQLPPQPVSGKYASGAAAPAATPASETLVSVPPFVQWRIEKGKLQKQTMGAPEWQSVNVHEQTFSAIAVAENQVWAGGRSGLLEHSSDNGAHWQQVKIAADGKSSSADVIAIRLQGQAVVVDLADHTQWKSLDQGKTWTKAVH